MNNSEIVVAALRWHTAHEKRMVIGAEKRKLEKAVKGLDWHQSWQLRAREGEIAILLTRAKRLELTALRALGKACEKQRGRIAQADDAELVIEAVLLGYSD